MCHSGESTLLIVLFFYLLFKLIFFNKQVVSVILENYGGPRKNSEELNNDKPGPQNRWVHEVLKDKGHVTPSPDVMIRVPSWRMLLNDKGEMTVTT